MKTSFLVRVLLSFLFFMCTTNLEAQRNYNKRPAFPQVWHCLETPTINPKLCDTISYPNSYTMMMVYKSLKPDSSQQLWKLNRLDDKYYSISTHFAETEHSAISLYKYTDCASPTIYTLQHTIQPDTSYHDFAQLYIGADMQLDTSHILLYEVAYFNRRISAYQSLMFQTYLAIKYGITLDAASYISTVGDTLWSAKGSKEFYNHIQGIGTCLEYSYASTESVSLEDSSVVIMSKDTLPEDNYILIGDNNRSLSWSQYKDDFSLLQRSWKMNIVGAYNDSIQIKVNLQKLQDSDADTLFLAILDNDSNIIQLVSPNQIIDSSYCTYSVLPLGELYFSFGVNKDNVSTIQPKKNNEKKGLDNRTFDYVNITPNPTDGDFITTIHLAETKPIWIVIQDMSGRVIHYQFLDNAEDYTYKGRITVSGVYILTISDSDRNIIATKELIVL